jgi:hypothetical protein
MNAGQIGDTLAEMIREELDSRNEIEQRIIAHRVRDAIEAWIRAGEIPPQPVKPMTDAEAQAFEQEPMEFGKYNGVKVKDVPLDYLIWVADAGRKTWQQIHAYLHSPRVAGEIRAMEDSDD